MLTSRPITRLSFSDHIFLETSSLPETLHKQNTHTKSLNSSHITFHFRFDQKTMAAALCLDSLPLGYRFRPTDHELIDFYLRNKITGHVHLINEVIREIDICKMEPWDLPGLSAIKSDDGEWFFFAGRDQKFPNSQRLNRATNKGYWKATGKDRNIKNRAGEQIGIKKTLVFYTGRAPKGNRTNWVMHEYRTTIKELMDHQSSFVLCRLFKKSDESVQRSQDDNTENVTTTPTSVLSNLNVKSENEVEADTFASGHKSNLNQAGTALDQLAFGDSTFLAPVESDDSCHYISGFCNEIDPEISMEQILSKLDDSCWTDDVPIVSNIDDPESDIRNFFDEGMFEFNDEMFEQFVDSSKDEQMGDINTSSTSSTETGIRLRNRDEVNQLGGGATDVQGNAVRRRLLQQKLGSSSSSTVYHCSHVRSHQTEAKSMIAAAEEIYPTNVVTRKWSLMYASDGKASRKVRGGYDMGRRKMKIWTAFAAVLFAVFVGFPAVGLLGKTRMLLD